MFVSVLGNVFINCNISSLEVMPPLLIFFKDKYTTLYNSVSSSSNSMRALYERILGEIVSPCDTRVKLITLPFTRKSNRFTRKPKVPLYCNVLFSWAYLEFGRGGQDFFFRLRIAKGVRGHAPPRNLFKTVQFGAF